MRNRVLHSTLLRILLLVLALLPVSTLIRAETQQAITVEAGQTLYSIARERLGNAGRWKEIADINHLSPPFTLQAGSTLTLPAAQQTSPAPISHAADTPAAMPTTATRAAQADHTAHPRTTATAPAESPVAQTSLPAAIQSEPAVSFVPDEPVTLSSLLAELALKNPSIRAAQESARAATFRPSQAASLPDPTVRGRLIRDQEQRGMVDPAMGTVSFANESMWKQAFEVSQMIPLGKLTPMANLEREMAGRMAQMAGMEAAVAAQRLRSAYAELYYVDRSARTLVRIRDLMKLVLSSAEALYRVGEGRQADLLRAQLEVSMLSDRLLMLQGRRGSAVAQINALLDRSASATVGTPIALQTYELVEPSSLDAAPAVKIAQAEVSAARAKIAVARSMFIPDLELMAGIQTNPGLNPMWEVGVGVTLPIWSGSRQIPALHEAETELKAAEERLRAAQASTRRDVQTALAMARTARSQSQLYDATIIPQARLTLESSLSSYRVSAVDFMTIVGNLATLLEYEVASHESISNFYKSVAMAEEASGASLAWQNRAVNP